MPGALDRPRRRAERGAVAVETALMSLVLVTIMGGIIDSSMLFRDSFSVSSASRAAARTAVSEPMATTFARDAAIQAVAAMSDTDYSRITRLWVYKADSTSGGPLSGSGCPTNCVKFTVSATGVVSSGTGSWHSRKACAGETLDAVGVTVQYKHRSTMGMFFRDKLITEAAVMQLEPIPSTRTCVSS